MDMTLKKVAGSRVSQKTRERVLEAIRKLDYNPNLTAKRLASCKTNSIGLNIDNEIMAYADYDYQMAYENPVLLSRIIHSYCVG